MPFLFFLLGLLVLFLFYHLYYKRLNYPPGPTPIPLLGNIPSLAKVDRFEHKFNEWKKIYGPVYTYWLGEVPIVSVNEVGLAVQAFAKDGDLFVNRGENTDFQNQIRNGYHSGLIFTEGQRWENQRRFALKFLRDFGLGKNQMQERIMDEVQFVIDQANRDIRAGVEEHNFYKKTDIAIGSVINSLIFGYRFTQEGNETEFYRLKDLTGQMMRGVNTPLVLLARYNNWIFHLTRRYCAPCYKPIDYIFEFVDNQIKKRIKTEDIDEDMEPRDMVDAFLIEKAKQKRLNLPSADLYTFEQLRGVAFDIWFAGQETTAATINWAIAFLIKNQQAQKKLHEELDRVIGSDRLISVADRQQLNYMNAVIMETQRTANIVSQNLFRQITQDIEIGGHKIKKGTFCLPQISVFHYNEKIFPEPDLFKPERFLDKNGQVIRCDELMPFSLGKRICLGEGLARMELFLFLANLFNQYEFFAGKEPPILKKFPTGGAASLQMYTCKLRKRFQ